MFHPQGIFYKPTSIIHSLSQSFYLAYLHHAHNLVYLLIFSDQVSRNWKFLASLRCFPISSRSFTFAARTVLNSFTLLLHFSTPFSTLHAALEVHFSILIFHPLHLALQRISSLSFPPNLFGCACSQEKKWGSDFLRKNFILIYYKWTRVVYSLVIIYS